MDAVSCLRSALVGFPGARAAIGFLLVALFLGVGACEGPAPENGEYGEPLVWPKASRLGDSVGWLISSDVLPDSQQAPTPFFTWTRGNVTV
jgi:hypothetical protein